VITRASFCKRATRQQHIVFREVAALHRTREPSPMRDAVGLRKNEIEGLSDRLLSAISQERLGPVVPQADYPA
jgi:hypothetical protein